MVEHSSSLSGFNFSFYFLKINAMNEMHGDMTARNRMETEELLANALDVECEREKRVTKRAQKSLQIRLKLQVSVNATSLVLLLLSLLLCYY